MVEPLTFEQAGSIGIGMTCSSCLLEQPSITTMKRRNLPHQDHLLLSSRTGQRCLKVESTSWLKSGQREKASLCSSSSYLGHQRYIWFLSMHPSQFSKSIIANGGWLRKILKILLDQIKKWVASVWAYFVQFLPLLVLTGESALRCTSSWQLIVVAFCIWHSCFSGVFLSKIYSFQCRFRLFLMHYCRKYCQYKTFWFISTKCQLDQLTHSSCCVS